MIRSFLLSCLLVHHGSSFTTPASPSISSRTPQTHLYSKTSDRAHIERNLEQMMGENWREFRAKLVAQERAVLSSSSTTSPQQSASTNSNVGDVLQTLSSMFKKKEDINAAEVTTTMTTTTDDDKPSLTEDPFLSAAELPIFSQKFEINKHRWAHEIPHVEPGSVLIANEKLGGVFHQTVVLMIQHCEKSGSIGIVINRPLDGNLLKIASENDCNLDLSLKLAFSNSPVAYGGPVLPQDFSILHGFGEVEGATKLCPGVFVGGSEELMEEIRINRLDHSSVLFVQGHAAWVPGQLSKEIAKGVWYTAAISSDMVLRYAGAKTENSDNTFDLWSDVLTCMGSKYADIAKIHQGRGDRRMP